MRPELSYIIPAHNAEAFIAETLSALRTQQPGRHGEPAPSWEAVIVDDRSTDGTVRVVKAIGDARLVVVRNPGPQRGPAAARRVGLHHATGRLVCFLDADDLPEPHSMAELVGAIKAEDADAVTGGYRLIDETGEDLCWSHLPENGDWSVQKLSTANRLIIGAVVVTRQALLAAETAEPRMFDAGCQSEDWAMWLHFARVAHDAGVRWAHVVDRPVLAYRQRSGSRSRQVMENLSSGLQIIQQFGADDDEIRAAAISMLRRAVSEALVEGDADLVQAASADIPPDERGGDQAAEAFVSPLRWSLACRGYLRPPGMKAAMADLLPQITKLAAGILHFDWSVVMRRALCGPEQLAMAASRLHATMGPSGRLVIYGLGRNGRAALRLVAGRDRVVAIDDDASRTSPVPRITVDDLTATDAVLVTPDKREPILGRIDGTPARVVLPEDVLLGRVR